MTRDTIPTKDEVKLNQSPPTSDWAKIRGFCENVRLEGGLILAFDHESIWEYLEIDDVNQNNGCKALEIENKGILAHDFL